MCDVCTDVLLLLQTHDERLEQRDGIQLSKEEVLAVVLYVQVWQQRQCMCCYRDVRNFEKFNNIVQVILNKAISFIQTLPQDCQDEQNNSSNCHKDQEAPKEQQSDGEEDKKSVASSSNSDDKIREVWMLEEKDKLFNFVAKVFLMNFPVYFAYKHTVHTTLDDLASQEAAALNNYCELNDVEVPVFLLRNVCFFCDSNGIAAIATCFDKAHPDILPYTVAHTLITIIANLRLWMNIGTVMQNIVPLRTFIIRYMCRLSDNDLRMAGTRSMTDLMWAAVKEPIETHMAFDKEGLELAFKYFTCSTLTIRLAGITQITNQINIYNELANSESLLEADSIGHELANWLIENKIIEHLFGPNLHVEIIKQTQVLLNFLAMEGRITNEHIQCMWAAGQLKHCSRQVHDVLIALIKHMEVRPVQHLLRLISCLDVRQCSEQSLHLASSLIKYLWNAASQHQVHTATVQGQQQQQHMLQGYKQYEDMDTDCVKPPLSSSEQSESQELEEGEIRLHGHRPRPMHHPCLQSPRGGGASGVTKGCCGGVHEEEEEEEDGSEEEEEEDEEEDSSACGNSDLSESEEMECVHRSHMLARRRQQHHRHHTQHHSHHKLAADVSEGSEEEEEEEEEECMPPPRGPRNVARRGRGGRGRGAVRGVQPHSFMSEEGDDEEEMCDDSEEAEIAKHIEIITGKDCVKMMEEDESSFYSSEPDDVKSPRRKKLIGSPNVTPIKPVFKRGERPGPLCSKKGAIHKCNVSREQDSAKSKEQSKEDKPKQVINEEKQTEETVKSKTNTSHPQGAQVDVEGQSGESEPCFSPDTDRSDKYMEQTAAAAAAVAAGKHMSQQELETFLETHHMTSEYIEDILSPDENSCNSSRMSAKSEKNMADFDGEDLLSDEELAMINNSAAGNNHLQQHLVQMANLYTRPQQKQMTAAAAAAAARRSQRSPAKVGLGQDDICNTFRFEDVCKPGNTLLWDILQDHTVNQLPEDLASDAEKVLISLVCYSTDRRIRCRFIEACVKNVQNNRSVVISLRLLPKLFGSFQQYRGGGLDTHTVTEWAEKKLDMMKHFFNNLQHYTNQAQNSTDQLHPLFSHKEQIQVRLAFLACVFSNTGSPDSFTMSREQACILWNSLANDEECSDDCFNWFLNQAKSKDHHALGLATFKHVFLEKMPQVAPERMSMVGLNLFTQLCSLARIANAGSPSPLPDDKICGMNQLWGIALRAHNTDVSLTAIHYLNNYYIDYGSGELDKEEAFIQRCMDNLVTASTEVDKRPEAQLLIIQRGLILLTHHLEGFRKRYAFHLRQWQLAGRGISSHQRSLEDKQSTPIRIVLQPAGSSEKTTLEMLSTDLVSELRAEVSQWWDAIQQAHRERQKQYEAEQAQQQQSGKTASVLTPILGAMLGEGPIRMITLGQELTVEMDEKSLAEMMFKDNQMVFVSISASRTPRKADGTTPASYLPAPDRDKIPMMLLLRQPHSDALFSMLQLLSDFRTDDTADKQNQLSLQSKAKVLSRKVWDLLMMLPTSPSILQGFKAVSVDVAKSDEASATGEGPDNADIGWPSLLDPHNPHKLMYSLQIVESLSRPPKHRRRTSVVSQLQSRGESSRLMSSESSAGVGGGDGMEEEEQPEELWSKRFVLKGGLTHLFSIFLSGSLQTKHEDNHWNEWHQDCLAYLLRLVSQLSVIQADMDAQDDVFELQESPRKKMKKLKANERVFIPRLNKTIMGMMEVESVVTILTTILYDAALPNQPDPHAQWPAASWGRAEVMHYAFSFLVSLSYSTDLVQPALCSMDRFSHWLKRIIMKAPEPPMRQEACQGLYKLCLGKTADGQTGYKFLMPVLANLLHFLDEAQNMKPAKRRSQEEKEPFGPSCRDYFWLVCRLVESMSTEDARASWSEGSQDLNLNELGSRVAELIVSRPYLEQRHQLQEDEGLMGLLQLATSIFKHNPPFKSSTEGQKFLTEIFWGLFALPSPQQRFLPKCKTQAVRTAGYDLMVEMAKGCIDNYILLHEKVLMQHHKDSHSPYSWDNWPHEEERSKCGYVGLTNLGATCYMATCMQHLYMIPEARKSVLEAKCSLENRHENTLVELQKMFAYLLESERKAYNPRSFCKVYTMDHQPLNTGEQKDMTEFFTDLITKLEEMGPQLRVLVKQLFGGVITNNVVSLDCPHVSRTKEEFYTVRCQVADMKSLYESLDEVCVKDMLEGDNMYTCSKCQRKVRAEKRACFKKLPKVLCFNTMRYTFNMVTMTKEKVNTHFSFPPRLNMSPYMESNLIKKERLKADESEKCDSDEDDSEESFHYELIGVTVHTGTAEGGHYYSFIRDRLNKTETGHDKWYLFNDAEVKLFDPAQIATECFGGEMTSKTYDSVTDKFMDFSFEKTNSAYMLFYERISRSGSEYGSENSRVSETVVRPESTSTSVGEQEEEGGSKQQQSEEQEDNRPRVQLSKELADWIWQDNMQFLQDKNIFEHTYFGFVWQMCSFLPSTLPRDDEGNSQQIAMLTAKLSCSFLLETYIHAKEKPTMLQWIEMLTKQFNSCHGACKWFLDSMAEEDWWPQQILIKCPNQMVRSMFHRLLIHVIKALRPTQHALYLHSEAEDENDMILDIGSKSCVTRFVKKMLAIIRHGNKLHCKFLTEYFAFLYDFAKMGDNECMFLLQVNAISTMVHFFMSHKVQDSYVEIVSDDDDDEEDDVIALPDDKYRPQSLEKMIALIAMLVEKSRGDDNQLSLCNKDYNAIVGGKGFPFLYNQIRDCINIRQTCNLIFTLSRWNERLAMAIIQMIFTAISRLGPDSQPFFKVLSLLTEFVGGPPGLPPFTHYILQKFWEVAEYCPQQCIEWLTGQVPRNKMAHHWTLTNLELWVEQFLLAHQNLRVRNATAYLLVALVPSNHFRQAFRNSRTVISPHKESITMSSEAVTIMHQVYLHLLRLLPRARQYVDAQAHGTAKLVPYFTVLGHCLLSRTEKLTFQRHFNDLWQLFQPKLSEPAISLHHNKQALLMFWHQVCLDCPENVKLIVTNAHVCKNIAFNYILADHEDQDVVVFNRLMLPAYYGILRMACHASRSFTRQLAQHQNIQWAFKNITPYPTQYTAAVEELFKMMRLMVMRFADTSEEEWKAITKFKRDNINLYLHCLEGRTNWQTLITALKILVETNEDRLLVLQESGMLMLYEAFLTLHVMHHEATACHVTTDIVDLLTLVTQILKVARHFVSEKKGDVKQHLPTWKETTEFCHKLLTLLNSYQPHEIRHYAIESLRELILNYQTDCVSFIVPLLLQGHMQFQDQNLPIPVGPYFPKRGQKTINHKSAIRCQRAQFQMFLQSNMLEATKGVDESYDQALCDYFSPYHLLVDLLLRVAVNNKHVSDSLIQLSAMVAYEGAPLHMQLFAKLWYEIYQTEDVDKKIITQLCNSSSLIDYVDAVLEDERSSLNLQHIYQFFVNYFPKVWQQILNDQAHTLYENIMSCIITDKQAVERTNLTNKDMIKLMQRINGDVKALMLIFAVQPPGPVPDLLEESLRKIQSVCHGMQEQRAQRLREEQLREEKMREEQLKEEQQKEEQLKQEQQREEQLKKEQQKEEQQKQEEKEGEKPKEAHQTEEKKGEEKLEEEPKAKKKFTEEDLPKKEEESSKESLKKKADKSLERKDKDGSELPYKRRRTTSIEELDISQKSESKEHAEKKSDSSSSEEKDVDVEGYDNNQESDEKMDDEEEKKGSEVQRDANKEEQNKENDGKKEDAAKEGQHKQKDGKKVDVNKEEHKQKDVKKEEAESDEEQPTTSSHRTKKVEKRGSVKERKIVHKPTVVDMLYKNIDSIFTIINKKS